MAFIDDSDLRQPEPETKVVYMQAPRSKLVPVLLVTLNLGVLVAIALGFFLMSGGKFVWPNSGDEVAQEEEKSAPSADDLDPELITTPTGRRLDLVEFGGYLFEVTRIAYTNSPASRTVTITVPARAKGEVPQQGLFHIGESFASGEIRVVEITSSSVVLECGSSQRVFPIRGASVQDGFEAAAPGKSFVPPRNTGAIPDLPDGQVRAPRHPMADEPEDPTVEDQPSKLENTGQDGTIEDLPDERVKTLKREDYLELIKLLPDYFANDFIFGVALERDTRMPYGLEIKNIAPSSVFFSYGLEPGDVIYAINDEPVTRVSDLDAIVKRNIFRDELRIEIERVEQVMEEGQPVYKTSAISFVFTRGLPD